MEQAAEQPKFIETWKKIAAHVGRSERWCRYMSAMSPTLDMDPLPVFRVGGIVRLNIADFDAWIDRLRRPTDGRLRR